MTVLEYSDIQEPAARMLSGGEKTAIYLEELHGSGVHLEDRYIHIIIEAIIIIPTLFGNLLILVCIAKFRALRSRSNILIANLAVADFLVGAILIPFDIAGMVWQHLSRDKWFCLLELSLYTCLLGASVLNNFVISLERFFVICCPLWYARNFKRRLLYILVATLWIVIAILSSLPFFGLTRTWPFPTPCSSDFVYTLEYKVLISLLVVSTLIASFILYGCVMKTAIGQLKKTLSSVENRHLRKYAKRTWLMITIFGVFTICWSPYVVLVTLTAFYHVKHLFRIRKWTTMLGLFNSGLNWIVYGLMNRRFRKAFICILTCRCDVNFSLVATTDPFVKPVTKKSAGLLHTKL